MISTRIHFSFLKFFRTFCAVHLHCVHSLAFTSSLVEFIIVLKNVQVIHHVCTLSFHFFHTKYIVYQDTTLNALLLPASLPPCLVSLSVQPELPPTFRLMLGRFKTFTPFVPRSHPWFSPRNHGPASCKFECFSLAPCCPAHSNPVDSQRYPT